MTHTTTVRAQPVDLTTNQAYALATAAAALSEQAVDPFVRAGATMVMRDLFLTGERRAGDWDRVQTFPIAYPAVGALLPLLLTAYEQAMAESDAGSSYRLHYQHLLDAIEATREQA